VTQHFILNRKLLGSNPIHTIRYPQNSSSKSSHFTDVNSDTTNKTTSHPLPVTFLQHRSSKCSMRHSMLVGRDSSVGIPTRYELDDPGIESRWVRDFPRPSTPTLGPTRVTGTGSLSWGSSSRCMALTTHFPRHEEVKERVKLYLYYPPVPSWPAAG
jgi:hypothetical protein